MTTFWRCLEPARTARGTTTGSESGADVRHGREHGHGTTTTTRGWGEGDG